MLSLLWNSRILAKPPRLRYSPKLKSLPSSFAYSFSSLYTKGRILKFTKRPLSSLANSLESSFEFDPVMKSDKPFSLMVLQASCQFGIFWISSKKTYFAPFVFSTNSTSSFALEKLFSYLSSRFRYTHFAPLCSISSLICPKMTDLPQRLMPVMILIRSLL